MRKIASLAAATVLAVGLGAGAARAEPGGCLKYGAAGAVGGHLVHHGVLGAAGGCATGMWRRHEYRKHQKELAREERMQRQEQGNAAREDGFGRGPDGGTYAR